MKMSSYYDFDFGLSVGNCLQLQHSYVRNPHSNFCKKSPKHQLKIMRKRENKCQNSNFHCKRFKMTKPDKIRTKDAPRRIFCLGDKSFTAGWISKKSCISLPFATELQRSLRLYPDFESTIVQTLYVETLAVSSLNPECYSHVMDKISQIQDSLIIILAGMHDLSLEGMTSDTLVKSICRLHQEAHRRGIRTIALGLPPSLLQEEARSIKVLAQSVNRDLEVWASVRNEVSFVPFPIVKYEKGGGAFCQDGFHFNKAGNRLIGSSLAPFVKDVFTIRQECGGKVKQPDKKCNSAKSA